MPRMKLSQSHLSDVYSFLLGKMRFQQELRKKTIPDTRKKPIPHNRKNTSPKTRYLDRYSAAEQKLFKALGFESLLHEPISVIALYRVVVEDAFSHSRQGPAVEALRRGFKEFNFGSSKILRMTKEFDALIEFDDGSIPEFEEEQTPV